MEKELYCEKCHKRHNGLYGSGRFCSSYCARSFSTSKDDTKQQKIILCTECNQPIIVNKRAKNKAKCPDCLEKEKINIKNIKRDKILINRQNNIKKYKIDKSPYKEFDNVYVNSDSFDDIYLYLTKHDENNKIIKRYKVYLYRFNIEFTMKRKLSENEVVHHIDFNHFNNDINNLIVVTRDIHNKIHSNKLSIEEVLNENLYVFKP